MAKTHNAEMVIKTMLTPKQHQTLKNRLKTAYQAYKKAEANVKVSTKKIAVAEKALQKASKLVTAKKTVQAKKEKIKAAENLKKVKAKLFQMKEISLDKAVDIKEAEFKLDNAVKKEAAWKKAAAAFEKKWEREYKQKQQKTTSTVKASSKKAAVKKTPAKLTKKLEVKPVVPKPILDEPKIERVSESVPVDDTLEVAAVVERSYPHIVEDTQEPMNPLPLNGLFKADKDDHSH